MKTLLSAIKPYIRWFILGGTLFFVIKAFKDSWQDITAIQIDRTGWLFLAIALLVTLAAHIWSGWVWSWILKIFKQPVKQNWAILVYLRTNIYKYIPGNVWHFYGRIKEVSEAGASTGVASLSVLLEPLLMAAAALIITVASNAIGLVKTSSNIWVLSLQIFILVAVLIGIQPAILNPIIHKLSKSKKGATEAKNVRLDRYPWQPLLGEIGFLIFRGSGFLLTLSAIMSFSFDRIPQLLSVFSFAWLLGLVIPGAPGGLGVFEATAIALLPSNIFPQAIILSSLALFRVVGILAEVIAAGIAILLEKKSKIQ
jgi:glycosyltransferase 2 family protein